MKLVLSYTTASTLRNTLKFQSCTISPILQFVFPRALLFFPIKQNLIQFGAGSGYAGIHRIDVCPSQSCLLSSFLSFPSSDLTLYKIGRRGLAVATFRLPLSLEASSPPPIPLSKSLDRYPYHFLSFISLSCNAFSVTYKYTICIESFHEKEPSRFRLWPPCPYRSVPIGVAR